MNSRVHNDDSPTHPRHLPTGSVEEFVALLSKHQRRLHLFITSLVTDPTEADDVLQETTLVLWREFAQFTPGTNFGAWASTVAFNQVLAWRKRRQRDRLVFSDEFLSAVAAELNEEQERLEAQARLLAGCVERIPTHHREMLRLRYTDGCSVEAIAKEVGRTPEAVYRMLSRIRQAIHDCVAQSLASGGA
jgi:RNA polymerase sigma-70 factor, ECF subfamily